MRPWPLLLLLLAARGFCVAEVPVRPVYADEASGLRPWHLLSILGVIGRRLDALEKLLDGNQFITGDKYTVADAYLFTVLNWTNIHKIDLAKWPNIKAYTARIGARPKVQETMRAEGLLG